MPFAKGVFFHSAVILLVVAALSAQQAATSPTTTIVPRLVNFSGRAMDAQGRPIAGIAGITFSIYKDQYEGSSLWMETQNVTADSRGNYTVQLGATTSQGLPLDLFTSGEARWLGVRVNDNEEQPRVLLLSVPYALKAADAQTLGGMPPSAFVLAVGPNTISNSSSAVSASPDASSDVTTTGGTANALPLFTTATNIQNSAITQTGSGSSAKVGINTTTPASALDVEGSATVRGALTLPSISTATPSAGKTSEPAIFTAAAFNTTTKASQAQKFQWQAEPLGNDTSATSGTLNLLFGQGSAKPAETGLNIASSGLITFASGQVFPGTGTITGVTAGADLIGGGTSGNVTLNLNTANVPQLNYANAFNALNTFPNVGIGTSSPLANLDVIGGGGLHVLVGDPGCGTFAAIGFLTSALSGCTNYALLGDSVGGTYINASGSSSTIHFRLKNIDVMDILPSGSVVVGNSSPPLDAVAGYFENDSDDEVSPALQALNAAPPIDEHAWAFDAGALNSAAGCSIESNGNFFCSGTKSAVVPVDGGSRKVALYAVEAPENWFEDLGSAQLSNGSARVDLEPTFAQTVNTDLDYHVFLTPNGDCKGLYVSQKSPTSFEVHELGGGTSSVAFDYRIIAKRKNYETVRLADLTERYKKLERQRATMRQRRQAAIPAASNPVSALQQNPGIHPVKEGQTELTQSAPPAHASTSSTK
jgi:hypothetical protein